jgi:hypothetical protein
MLATAIAIETNGRLAETVHAVKRNLPILVKESSIGDRLVEAFGTNDKAIIAKKLGFSSVQSVYKVIRGERELSFQHLINFRNSTKRTIDWLLTGENVSESVTIPSRIRERLAIIAREQAPRAFADAQIAADLAPKTLELLTSYLLDEALMQFGLTVEPLMSKADRRRAEKMTFVREKLPGVEDMFRRIVQEELQRLHADDIGGEVSGIEAAEQMAVPYYGKVDGGEEDGALGEEKVRKVG